MTIYKFIRIISWFILTIFCFSAFCAMMTAASTILNIFGIAFIAFWIFVSYKSKCFLTIKYKSDAKNN